MKKILIIFIIVLSISSCTFNQGKKNKDKEFSSLVDELLKRKNYVIPDSLFSFFPDDSDNYKQLIMGPVYENAQKMEVPLYLSEFDPVRITEIYQCDNKESLQQLINGYRSKAIFSIKSEIKDYFVVASERELLKESDTLQLKDRFLAANERVILSFKESVNDMSFLYDTTTTSGLSAGYEILALKSGDNFVLPSDHLYEWPILPENLKHGYRSGVAFKENDSYIIYWVVAW